MRLTRVLPDPGTLETKINFRVFESAAAWQAPNALSTAGRVFADAFVPLGRAEASNRARADLTISRETRATSSAVKAAPVSERLESNVWWESTEESWSGLDIRTSSSRMEKYGDLLIVE